MHDLGAMEPWLEHPPSPGRDTPARNRAEEPSALGGCRAPRIRNSRPTEREALLDWLDRGLRDGQSGALFAEHPFALAAAGGDVSVVAEIDGQLASHALPRTIEVETDDFSMQLGMIGLVYTDPTRRRRGLARWCIETCCERLAEDGVALVALWSELWPYYRSLGFEPAGTEIQYLVTPPVSGSLRRKLPAVADVGPVHRDDWATLEDLYREKPVHVARAPGELERLAAVPNCQVVVARDHGRPIGYAAMGRGADFQGVVHEWAGSAAAVLACIAELSASRKSVRVVAGPAREPLDHCLRSAGVARQTGCFALMRLLDASAIWRSLVAPDSPLHELSLREIPDRPGSHRLGSQTGEVELDHGETLALLFGPNLPMAALRLLSGSQRNALRERLPWPLFAWGFDSI